MSMPIKDYNIYTPYFSRVWGQVSCDKGACMRWQRICSAEIADISISCMGTGVIGIILLEFGLAEDHVWALRFHTPYVVLRFYRFG